MTRASPEPETRCPGCGEPEGGLIEFDKALQRWVCGVCGRMWATGTDASPIPRQ